MEDEDVVFEKSPLYCYLLESGFEDVGISRQVENISRSRYICSKSRLILGDIWNAFFGKLQRYFTCNNIIQEASVINYVLNSTLLEEDDKAALENIQPQIHALKEHPKTIVGSIFSEISFLALLISTLYGIFGFEYEGRFLKLFRFICVFVSLIWVFRFCLKFSTYSLWSREIYKLKSFINVASRFDGEIKKAISLILDREYIWRGFTIVSQQHMKVDNNNFVEPSNSQVPLLVLRKRVLASLTNLLKLFRAETKELLAKLKPDNLLQDQFVITSLDADYFQCILTTQDCLTLSGLKAFCRYLSLQRSEFLRLYVYCRCKNMILSFYSSSTFTDYTLPWFLTNSCFNRLITKLEENQNTLRVVVNLNSPKMLLEKSVSRNQVKLSTMDDHSAILRSLQLHLQVALEKTLGLTDFQNDETSNCFLNEMEVDLKASVACVEELRHSFIKGVKCEPVANNPLVFLENKKPNVRFIDEDYEPFVEDQVFEAYVQFSDEPSGVNAEKELYSETSMMPRRNLLDELKSVLCVRSKLMQERELRALAQSRGLSIDDLIKERDEEDEQIKLSLKQKQLSLCDEDEEFKRANVAEENSYTELSRDGIKVSPRFGDCLADELKKALRARGDKNLEMQIGESDSEESIE